MKRLPGPDIEELAKFFGLLARFDFEDKKADSDTNADT